MSEKKSNTVSTEPILISFCGDDFTGTAATAKALTQYGLPTVIFNEPPSPSYLEKHFPRKSKTHESKADLTLFLSLCPRLPFLTDYPVEVT